jgi:hypothetical protein
LALHVFQPRDATLARFRATGGSRAPENAPNGVVLDYWIGEAVSGDVEIEVRDASGVVIREFEGSLDEKPAGAQHDGGGLEGLREVMPGAEEDAARQAAAEPGQPEGEADEPPEEAEDEAGAADDEEGELEDANLQEEDLDVEPGMNRFVWDLRYPGPDVIEGAQFSLANTGGMWAPPGAYTLRVEAGGEAREVTVRVRLDPRIPSVTEDDMHAQLALARQVRDRLTEVHQAIRDVRDIREHTGDVIERMKDEEGREAVASQLDSLRSAMLEELSAIEKALIQTGNETGQDPINMPSMLDDQLAYLYSHVTGSYGRPTEGAYQRFQDLEALTEVWLQRLRELVAGQLARFQRVRAGAGVA